MADFRAVAAVGEALVGLLKGTYEAHRARFNLPEAEVRLIQAKDLQKDEAPVQSGRGVTVYLYRLALNANRRNLPARLAPGGKRLPPPIPLDLHYLVTAWWESQNAHAAKEQQWLLALAVRTLEDNPTLPAGILNHYANAAVFREDENVEVIGEVLSMAELVSIWEVNKAKMQASATYLARAVLIDSERELFEAEPVQLRDFVLARPRGSG